MTAVYIQPHFPFFIIFYFIEKTSLAINKETENQFLREYAVPAI